MKMDKWKGGQQKGIRFLGAENRGHLRLNYQIFASTLEMESLSSALSQHNDFYSPNLCGNVCSDQPLCLKLSFCLVQLQLDGRYDGTRFSRLTDLRVCPDVLLVTFGTN